MFQPHMWVIFFEILCFLLETFMVSKYISSTHLYECQIEGSTQGVVLNIADFMMEDVMGLWMNISAIFLSLLVWMDMRETLTG